jgi:hypothetical protein
MASSLRGSTPLDGRPGARACPQGLACEASSGPLRYSRGFDGSMLVGERGFIMHCNVCGGSRFLSTEYNTGSKRAPALECTKCHALVLDQAVARTDEERESVKMAVALRTAARIKPTIAESDTFETATPVRKDAEKRSKVQGK